MRARRVVDVEVMLKQPLCNLLRTLAVLFGRLFGDIQPSRRHVEADLQAWGRILTDQSQMLTLRNQPSKLPSHGECALDPSTVPFKSVILPPKGQLESVALSAALKGQICKVPHVLYTATIIAVTSGPR